MCFHRSLWFHWSSSFFGSHLILRYRRFNIAALSAFGSKQSSVGKSSNNQIDGLDRVIVCRNWIVYLSGIAVGIDHSDTRDVEFLRLFNSDGFFLDIHNYHSTRDTLHVPYAHEVLVDSLHFTSLLENFTLFKALRPALFLHVFKFLKTENTFVDRVVIGKSSAQPAFSHKEHSRPLGMLPNTFSSLLFRSNEKNILASCNNFTNKVDCVFKVFLGFLQIDDMDTVSCHEDVILHAWVPSLLLVTEVYTGLQQVLN